MRISTGKNFFNFVDKCCDHWLRYFESARISFVIANVNSKMGSEYYRLLSSEDKKQYNEKLTLNDGTQLEDPYAIERAWTDDITKLPNICWSDVTKYLIETPSVYAKEAVKAYKSSDGYGFFREGHVQDCCYHDTTSK